MNKNKIKSKKFKFSSVEHSGIQIFRMMSVFIAFAMLMMSLSGNSERIYAAKKKLAFEGANINLTSNNTKYTLDFGEKIQDQKAVQNFYVDSNSIYTSQRIEDNKKTMSRLLSST